MTRLLNNCHALVGVLGLCLTLVIGCTEPGQPWGTLDLELDATFDPGASRYDDQGRLITANNYRVALEDVALAFDTVTVVMAPEGTAGFDPANPPDGYTLCHNGHCHNDAGALVDYEVIALELAGGGSGGSRVTVALDGKDTAVIDAGAVAVDLIPCEPSPCELPQGKLVAVELLITSLRVSGTAYDREGLATPTLPAEGFAFNETITLSTPFIAEIEGEIGRGQPVGLWLTLAFDLPASFLDTAPFEIGNSAGDDPGAVAAWQSQFSAAVEAAVSADGLLTAETDRF